MLFIKMLVLQLAIEPYHPHLHAPLGIDVDAHARIGTLNDGWVIIACPFIVLWQDNTLLRVKVPTHQQVNICLPQQWLELTLKILVASPSLRLWVGRTVVRDDDTVPGLLMFLRADELF